MRVALIQMNPTDDLERNLLQAEQLVSKAVQDGKAELVVLPEMWSCLGGASQTKQKCSELLPEVNAIGGKIYSALQSMARKHKAWVHGGSIGEKMSLHSGLLSNTYLVFDCSGNEQGRYRKIHLFDVVTPNGEGYRESDSYAPGSETLVINVDGVKAGLAICYDLRFPELFLELRKKNAELIFLPAAFTQQTGEAHWEIMIRARAIEAQAWVVACGTTGWHVDAHGEHRQTYGNSMIVNPWGEVVLRMGDDPGWSVAELDMSMVTRVRERMPVHANRRLV